MSELTGGRTITIYGQNRVLEDLVAARRPPAGLLYEVSDVSLHDLEGDRPTIRYTHEGRGRSSATSSPAATDSTASAARRFRPAS